MNDIRIFENPDFGTVRTLVIDGQPYWIAADVTRILGYNRTNDAVKRHCHSTLKRRTMTAKGERELNYIPESDLYRLIVHSKLPTTKAFEKWVFEEVLPQIRQTGGYGNAGDGDIRAELAALRTEIRGLREAMEKPRQIAAPKPEDEMHGIYKAYINASLDLCERLFHMTRSQILHVGYISITKDGMDIEEIKRTYKRRHNLSACTTIDAVIEDPSALHMLVYNLCSNIVATLYDRRGKIAEDKRENL